MALGAASRLKLATCRAELRRVIEAAAAGVDRGDLAWAGIRDTTVHTGYRGEAAQNKAFAEGYSQEQWPESAHNKLPSDAADFLPYPELWSDTEKCRILHAYTSGVARAMGVQLFHIGWDPAHIEFRA